jgi:hypothetical protein
MGDDGDVSVHARIERLRKFAHAVLCPAALRGFTDVFIIGMLGIRR